MIRIYEYNNASTYKDFESYVFTALSRSFFDIPQDKVTIRGTDYRISSIIELDDANSVGGGSQKYTGDAELNVGGISSGKSFVNAEMQEMWDSLIKQEMFPVLVAPKSTFTLVQEGLQEIGNSLTLNFLASFNRGTINPAYSTNGFRAGLPNSYIYTGAGLTNVISTLLTNSNEIIHEVVPNAQTWTSVVAFDEGEQPKSSYNNDFDSPLSAGQTSEKTRSIIGVYPFFGTTSNIGEFTKQPLARHNETYFQINMVAENDTDKQIADFSTMHRTITGVQFYNTVSGAWEWINRTKINSLSAFTTSAVNHTVQGNVINYTRYEHNGVKTGARMLRFFTN